MSSGTRATAEAAVRVERRTSGLRGGVERTRTGGCDVAAALRVTVLRGHADERVDPVGGRGRGPGLLRGALLGAVALDLRAEQRGRQEPGGDGDEHRRDG